MSNAPLQHPCCHLGDQARLVLCPSCGGHVQVKVHNCILHNECTQAKPLPGITCCQTCPDYDIPLPTLPLPEEG
jgi:hypothetical protein